MGGSVSLKNKIALTMAGYSPKGGHSTKTERMVDSFQVSSSKYVFHLQHWM